MLTLHHPESDAYYAAADITQNDWDNGCNPVTAADLPAGTVVVTGPGNAIALPDFDFETYSEAGYEFVEGVGRAGLGKWEGKGLAAVGAPVYAEHLSTEVICMAYNLKDGKGKRLWIPGMPPPQELFDHIARGGLLEAHNSGFEWLIWNYTCTTKYGWPALPHTQLRCSASKCRSFSIPASLAGAGRMLELDEEDAKIKDGKRLIKKFSCPRTPTKTDARRRIRPEEDPVEATAFYNYCLGDIVAESAVSALVPDLSTQELDLWLLDQTINFTGCQIDMESVESCRAVIEQATAKGNEEIQYLAGNVQTIGQVKEIRIALAELGIHMPDMRKETIAEHYDNWDELHPQAGPEAKRILELRATLGSASVKKLYTLGLKTNKDGRLREMFAFCGADRTGRWSGRGAQPQNLPNSGPKVMQCDKVNGCGRHYSMHLDECPWCRAPGTFSARVDWNVDAVEDALAVINHCPSLDYVGAIMGEPVAIVSACLRGLFIAAPGKELMCSDYSAIEAVVIACLAGEQWRIDVFNTHAKIYEASASAASGVTLEEILQHKKDTGDHHPLRKLGKVRELAGGYQGGQGAWKNFGADKFMSDDEIAADVKKWRAESPAIKKMWYELNDAAIAAVKHPGQYFGYRGITYGVKDNVLYCRLLSGRLLKYHKPHIAEGKFGNPQVNYWGRDSTTNQWACMDTYGGKLTENVVQATARDIMAFAMLNLAKAGYQIVMHVHDEIVSEIEAGWGSIEEFETIMATLPAWCADWPIKAAGGWRGKRYRKD